MIERDDEDWGLFPQNSAAPAAGFGDNLERTRARQRRERIAGKTKAEREKKPRPKKHRTVQVNVRTTTDTKQLMDRVAKRLDCSVADMIEMAVTDLARREGLIKGGHDEG